MTNQSITTTSFFGSQVIQAYSAPSAIIQNTGYPLGTLYIFLAKVDPWVDENNPPLPGTDPKSIKNIFRNMFVIKKVTAAEISPVIQRSDWTANTVYDYYQDNVDILAKDANGFNLYTFYAKNRYDQVFKCLWNANGSPATVEPFFRPGTYGTNNIFIGSDGYKWKFMYAIGGGSKRSFMDAQWMPISPVLDIPNPIENSEGYGAIEIVGVVRGGGGFDPANSPITIVFTGDGQNAAGYAAVTGNSISDVIMTNPGQNYTFANATAVSSNGSNAVFATPTSPVGGHGLDPFSEPGCSSIMFTVEFNSSEGGIIPTDIEYRQVGLLANPLTQSSIAEQGDNLPANGAIYPTYTSMIVSPGLGTYTNDETIYQGTSANAATFSATVLDFNASTNQLTLINILGTPILNASIFGNSSKTTRTLLSVSYPDYVGFSGYILYIENITSVTRSTDGIEQFRFVVSY